MATVVGSPFLPPMSLTDLSTRSRMGSCLEALCTVCLIAMLWQLTRMSEWLDLFIVTVANNFVG